MKEQDKPGVVSTRARTLIEGYVSDFEIVNNRYNDGEKDQARQRLKKAKEEIGQMTIDIGFPVFFVELERFKQKSLERCESSVSEFCTSAFGDPFMGDFYDNEANAAFIGHSHELSGLKSVRSFLEQLQLSKSLNLGTLKSC